VLGIIVFASTFVPKGSFSLNPKIINNTALTGDVDSERQEEDAQREDDSSDEKTEKPTKSTDIGAMIG
jgi:hypothetical protein